MGGTRTNSEIIRTATATPADFFFFNNGVSCVATSITIDGDKLMADGLQVINGAQTVRALAKTFAKDQGHSWIHQSPQIIVRVTEIEQGYAQDRKFLEDVTRFNNSQNVIKASDFRSNDSIQLDLARKFSDLRRPGGRQVKYVPKRTDKRWQNTDIIRLEEFSKVLYSFLKDPVSFSGSTSFLFDDSEKGGYVWVFGDGTHYWEAMPAEEFRLRAAIWWMAQAFSERIGIDRDKQMDKDLVAALERKWMLLYVARLILERNYGSDFRSVLAKYHEGAWVLGEKAVGVWFEKLYNASKQSVQFVYKTATKQPGFVHRNWMRSQKTVQELNDYATIAPGLEIGPPPQAAPSQ